jgi:hypothetical protein
MKLLFCNLEHLHFLKLRHANGLVSWGGLYVPPRLNLATQFLTVAYDGACSPNVSIWMAWISIGALQEKKIDDSLRLDVVEITRVTWLVSFQPLEQEKASNSAHEQTTLSNDTIDSILRHQEVGGTKDLTAPPRKP